MIVPIGKKEENWRDLLTDLIALDPSDELILVTPKDQSQAINSELKQLNVKFSWRLVTTSSPGRALQMNQGVQQASNDHLFFLHADSKITPAALEKIKIHLTKNSQCIYFFSLEFLNDGPKLMPLNTWGAKFRSEVLKLPFGDQGLAMEKNTFQKLGGFDESAPYGEDHLLIWKAHQNKIPLKCLGPGLKTSARKYKNRGWALTTYKHISLSLKQAFPELIKLFKIRIMP